MNISSRFGISRVAVGISTLILVLSCSDIEAPQIGTVTPSEIMAQARISTNSVVMQIGDSLQLSVRATSAAGTDMNVTQADYIKWSSSSGDVVKVDSLSGLIKGVSTTAGAPVNISVVTKYGMVTKRHTIPVYVTADRIDVSEVKLIALDSLRVPFGGLTTGVSGIMTPPRIRLEAYYNGAPITVPNALTLDAPPGSQFTFDRDAQVYLVTAGSLNIGKFMIRLSGNLYGNEVSDSIEFESIYKSGYLLPNFDFSWEFIEEPQAKYGFIQVADSIWRLAAGWEHNRDVLQKCAAVVIRGLDESSISTQEDFRPGFRYPPLDIIFEDSASTSECDYSTVVDTSRFEQIMGGNIYNWSKHDKGIIRKSSTVGEVKWYIRDAITKEVLINGRYVAKDSEN